jgi:hypothetical protein
MEESRRMRFEVFWRVAVVQLLAVAALSIVLAIVFSHGFFEDWGWLVGPLTWLGCARFTSWAVGLEPAATMIRAVGAGLVSALFVIAGLHWLGALIAVGLLAYLCAREPGEQTWT